MNHLTLAGVANHLDEVNQPFLACSGCRMRGCWPMSKPQFCWRIRRAPNAGAIRHRVEAMPAEAGVEPEAIWHLADKLGYKAIITWSAAGVEDCFDVVFHHLKVSRKRPGIP